MSQQEFLSALVVFLIRFTLLITILVITLFPLTIALFHAQAEESIGLGIALYLAIITVGSLGLAGYVVLVLQLLAASAKRLRDAGLSPYWTLLHFTTLSIPFTIFLAIYRGNTNAKNPEAASQAAPVQNFDAPPFTPPAFDIPPQVAPFVDVSETPSKPKKRKQNPFSWYGRASQLEFFLIAIILFISPFPLESLHSEIMDPSNNIGTTYVCAVLGFELIYLLFIPLFFAVTPRRFRDAGLSPYWSALFLLVPTLGLIGGVDFGPSLAIFTYWALVFFLAYYPSKPDDAENEENDVPAAVSPQAPAIKYCVNCGAPLPTPPNPNQSPIIKYCVKCGAPLPTQTYSNQSPIIEEDALVKYVLTFAHTVLAFFLTLFLVLLFRWRWDF